MREPDHLLILRPGALGDVILALPPVAALRAMWPKTHFCWVGYPAYLEWLQDSPYLNSFQDINSSLFCHLFDKQFDERLFCFLKRFDYCVAWVNDQDGMLAKLLPECFDERFVLAPPFPVRGSKQHASTHLLDSLHKLIPVQDRRRITEYPSLCVPASAQQELWRNSSRWGLFHPGSGSRLKCWSLDHFQAAAIAIRGATGLAIRWLLGPAETMIQRETQIFCSLNQMSCCTDLAVREIAAMLQHACFFLGNDSGIAHLAAAIGIPTFVLFGPTDPAEWAPWGPNVNVIRHLESCSPCSKAEMLSCADRRCLYSIDVESVISLIIAKIANGGMETIYGH